MSKLTTIFEASRTITAALMNVAGFLKILSGIMATALSRTAWAAQRGLADGAIVYGLYSVIGGYLMIRVALKVRTRKAAEAN
jgi:hypothetical protein